MVVDLRKTTREASYWKVLVTQTELYSKLCKIRHQFKKRKTFYGDMTPKDIAELKLWYSEHADLIGLYSKSVRQHQPGGTIIKNNVSLTYMNMIDPTAGFVRNCQNTNV